ncbi:hypothetical protein DFS34DRAFT_628202 [Phlyctochytrium arcticum]|nr:hypothetical protein DFS34DRAFT_628202 [Phlyctochytrium arcticum]
MKLSTAIFALTLVASTTIAAPAGGMQRRRFGQQNPPVQGEIGGLAALKNGQAGTLSGQVPSTLLGAADPCLKLRLADTIVQEAGGDAAALAAAQRLVNAEQNFNPFNGGKPTFCADASLPATPALRGILPLISEEDNLNNAAATNVITKKSLADALAGTVKDVTGKSIAQQLIDAGFNDFKNAGGAATPPPPATGTTAPPPPPAPTTPTAGGIPKCDPVPAPAPAPTAAPAPAPTGVPAPAAGVIFQPAGLDGLTFDPLVRSSDPARPFQVAQDTFVQAGAACGRVGDRLNNKCANNLNASGRGSEIGAICTPAKTTATQGCLTAAGASA